MCQTWIPPPPCGVADRVRGDLVRGQDQVDRALLAEPGAPRVPLDQPPHRRKVRLVGKSLRPRGRRAKRMVAFRGEVVPPGRGGRPGRGRLLVRVPGAGQDGIRQPRGIVWAQNRRLCPCEREVDQGLVPGRLADLRGRAPGPDRLADVTHALAGVLVGERADLGDYPRRVAAQLGDVREDHLARHAVQGGADHAGPVAGQRDQRGLAPVQAGPDERGDPAGVLRLAAIEERRVAQTAPDRLIHDIVSGNLQIPHCPMRQPIPQDAGIIPRVVAQRRCMLTAPGPRPGMHHHLYSTRPGQAGGRRTRRSRPPAGWRPGAGW